MVALGLSGYVLAIFAVLLLAGFLIGKLFKSPGARKGIMIGAIVLSVFISAGVLFVFAYFTALHG